MLHNFRQKVCVFPKKIMNSVVYLVFLVPAPIQRIIIDNVPGVRLLLGHSVHKLYFTTIGSKYG